VDAFMASLAAAADAIKRELASRMAQGGAQQE
jgi:hypothetical protein